MRISDGVQTCALPISRIGIVDAEAPAARRSQRKIRRSSEIGGPFRRALDPVAPKLRPLDHLRVERSVAIGPGGVELEPVGWRRPDFEFDALNGRAIRVERLRSEGPEDLELEIEIGRAHV